MLTSFLPPRALFFLGLSHRTKTDLQWRQRVPVWRLWPWNPLGHPKRHARSIRAQDHSRAYSLRMSSLTLTLTCLVLCLAAYCLCLCPGLCLCVCVHMAVNAALSTLLLLATQSLLCYLSHLCLIVFLTLSPLAPHTQRPRQRNPV